MPAKVSVDGLARALDNLDLIGKVPHTKAAKKIYFKWGTVVRRKAQELAPYDPDRKKGTHLRDAILVSEGPLIFPDVLVTVRYKRPGAPHAHLIEFGTVRMAAQPFMRPAAAITANEVGKGLREDFIELIKSTPR